MAAHIDRQISVDYRHVESAEPRRIPDDLDLGDLAVRDPEGKRSRVNRNRCRTSMHLWGVHG
jgi:hypothetical protein